MNSTVIRSKHVRALAAMLLVAGGVACQLGDLSVYDRGDLGQGSSVDTVTPPNGSASSSSGSSTSSGGALDDSGAADASVDAEVEVETGPPPCTPFDAPAGWIYAQRGLPDDYIATGLPAGDELNYLLTGGYEFDLSQGQNNTTCQHCVKWVRGGKVFFQQSGMSRVQSVNGCNTGLIATLSDLVLREVIYDGTTYQTVPGGQCLTATGPIQVNTYVDCF